MKMKVALYIGLFDDTFPLTNNGEEIYRNLGPNTVSHWVVAPWTGHALWGVSASDWLTEDISAQLSVNQ